MYDWINTVNQVGATVLLPKSGSMTRKPVLTGYKPRGQCIRKSRHLLAGMVSDSHGFVALASGPVANLGVWATGSHPAGGARHSPASDSAVSL
jgi:hypothetical protein